MGRPGCLSDKTGLYQKNNAYEVIHEAYAYIDYFIVTKVSPIGIKRLAYSKANFGFYSILNRNNFTNARLGGLEDDIGILIIMYVGYLLFQFPSNDLSKFPHPGIYLLVAACLWGGVGTRHRLSLAFHSPGALLILASWYSRAELPPRIAFLYARNTLSNCFGGLIAAGILDGMEGVGGLRAWRWPFIIE